VRLRRLVGTAALAITLGSGVAFADVKPQAAYAETLGQYHMPTGKRVCIEDHGWTRWDDVLPNIAWRLRANGITDAVVWNDCSSQPDAQVITLAYSNSPDEFYCARTERGYYSNGTALGRTTIRVNMADKWFAQCHQTWSQRAHVMSHETGHALGLPHNDDPASVMFAGSNNPWLLWWGDRDYQDLRSIYVK
jgi:hypothetical protein